MDQTTAEDPQLEKKEQINIAEEGAGSGWSPSDSGTLFAPPPAGPWGKRVPCKGVPTGAEQS